MTEKNYVVNVKNKQGTIVTFRGDTAQELSSAISNFIDAGLETSISMVESILLDTPVHQASGVDTVMQSLGATVIDNAPSFAPVPPPQQTIAATTTGSRMCNHGPMVGRKGNGAKGEWKGLFCPLGKDATGKCDPVWLNRSMPEWASI